MYINGRPSKIAFKKEFFSFLKKVEPFQNVVDVGCASGKNRELFREKTYCGIDFNSELIEQAKLVYGGDSNSRFRCGDVLKRSDLPDEYFDLVVCTHTLAHIPLKKKQVALGNLALLAREDGHVLLQCTTNDWNLLDSTSANLILVDRISYRGSLSRNFETIIQHRFGESQVSTMPLIRRRPGGRLLVKVLLGGSLALSPFDRIGRKDHELILLKKAGI